jgi:hypothetical protein
MKIEATYSSETSVNFQRTTRRYIPEDRSLKAVLIHLSQNRDLWWAAVNMVMSSRVPLKAERIMTERLVASQKELCSVGLIRSDRIY